MNEQKRKPVGILLTVILIAALLTICLELGLSYLRPDTPGSIPKHLIHFGIMFALLGGAVLLCLFCPPFKKLWAWIDEHILSQETRPIAIDIIYAVFAGLMLLHHFYVILYYPTLPTGATKFAPIWLVLAAITVLLGKSWRNISFRLAAIFFIFTFERLYLEKLVITGETAVYFFSAIYALFFCLNVFSMLHPSIRISSLQVLCSFWVLFTMIIGAIGLYMAWTGAIIKNLSGSIIYTERGRLSIFSAATITASFLCSGSVMAIIGFVISKHNYSRLFYFFSFLITLTSNSLTDARSSFLMIGTMSAGVLCIYLWSRYHDKFFYKITKSRKRLAIILLFFCFGLCTYLAIQCQQLLASTFINARNHGIIVPPAQAESIQTQQLPILRQREVWLPDNESIDFALSGRYEIWEKGLQYIRTHPESLLFGVSIDKSVATIIDRQDHIHNILLQLLLEGGIPALLLYLSIIIYFTYHAFRLWNRRGIPFWQRVLPLPVFSILFLEMAECLSHFAFGHPPMTLLWFFLGATITVSKSLGKAPKTAEQPAIPAESAVTETGE